MTAMAEKISGASPLEEGARARALRLKKSLDMLNDLRELVQYIHKAKGEIAALRPDEIKNQHLSVASDELDAIVQATEEATNEIMEAAETIETFSGQLDEAGQEAVGDAVTRIFQACSFQDITGQRISKVVGALKHIEAKVEHMVGLLGGSALAASLVQAGPAEPAEPEDPEAKLLNGPQLPGKATRQDEIDAMFG
ncbi:MAG: protein phosphatase CheZ [Alphaproteobacteria bacterium]